MTADLSTEDRTPPGPRRLTRRGLIGGALGVGSLLALPTGGGAAAVGPRRGAAPEALRRGAAPEALRRGAAPEALRRGAAPDGLWLPTPTGRFAVGTMVAHLVDPARPDPFAPVPRARELMAQVWYPAAGTVGCGDLPYLSAATAAVIGPEFGIPPDLLTGLRLDAHTGAAPRARPGGYPVLLFSPGLGLARSSVTALVTDLASHGYVVVTLDHPYDSHVVEFPDGRLVLRSVDEGGDPSVKSGYVAVRAADARFTAGQLAVGPLLGPVRAIADFDRLGMVGHSIGGATAAQVLQDDPRFVAGINLDGSVYDPAAGRETHQPFALMGGDWHHRGNDLTWARFWTGLTGWRRDFGVTGLGHYDFTDYRSFADRLGTAGGLPPEIFGPIGAERGLAVVRAYLRAFADRHLAGSGGSLVEHPSSRYPEVVFR